MPITKTSEGLKRVVGVQGLALSMVNITIGAGIFVLPAIVGIAMGVFGLLGYLFCSIMMTAIMLCYAEIGSRVTSSGGTYAYVEAAFGKFPGFIINWMYLFGYGVLSCAALLNIIAYSLSILFPIFLNPLIRAVFLFLLVGFMVLINVRGAKQGVGFVKAVTIIKLLPLLAIIIFGLSFIKSDNLHLEQLPSMKTFGNTALVLFFAFAGFKTALGVSGEVKNSKRTVPLSILVAGIIVLTIYVLLQTVVQGVLGTGVAAFKDAPLAAVAQKIIGPVGATLLIITTAISCFGSVSTSVLAGPRSLFAGANDGMFPKILGRVHPKFATPHYAIICYAAMVFFFSIMGGFKQLAVLASATGLLIYLAVILATIKLRTMKQTEAENTFKIRGGLVIPFIGIAAILWLLTSLSKTEVISTGIFLSAACVIYFIMKKMKKEIAIAVIGNEVEQSLVVKATRPG